jgi:hemoglobin
MLQGNPGINEDILLVYSKVGGEAFFIELVNRFYEYVTNEPLLRPMYPKDLDPGKAHLSGFLVQYFGGPAQYSVERGHPRLRQRHRLFAIGQAERDAWVSHMTAAVKSMDAPEYETKLLTEYFENTATLLMNR